MESNTNFIFDFLLLLIGFGALPILALNLCSSGTLYGIWIGIFLFAGPFFGFWGLPDRYVAVAEATFIVSLSAWSIYALRGFIGRRLKNNSRNRYW